MHQTMQRKQNNMKEAAFSQKAAIFISECSIYNEKGFRYFKTLNAWCVSW